MIVLTLPIVFPIIIQLGVRPIWFGIVLVVSRELGIIHLRRSVSTFREIKASLPEPLI